MPADYSRIWPVIIAMLAVLMIYRRFRRNFGRQPVRPLRMSLRMGLLIVVGVSLVPLVTRGGQFLLAQMLGAAAGVALALWGAQRTRYVKQDEQLFYVPHTYAGIAVSLLVLGRIVYRIAQVYAMGSVSGAGSSAASASGMRPLSMVQSPLTAGLFFVLIGYYVCYYGQVLWKSKHLKPEDLEEPSVAVAP
jgi:hypothetical protein